MANSEPSGSSAEGGVLKKIPPARLPSLRGPRDLTLGGVRKKIFSPNLNTVKQNPAQDWKATSEPSGPTLCGDGDKVVKRKRSGKGQESRGRDRKDHGNIVQLKSIFEETSRDLAKSRAGRSPQSSARSGREATSGRRRVVKIESSSEEEEETDSDGRARLNKYISDDFIDIKHLEVKGEILPVFLPNSEYQIRKNHKVNVGLKLPVKVKSEQRSDDESLSQCSDGTELLSNKSDELCQNTPDVSQLFLGNTKSDQHDLMLIQLPDILPAIRLSTNQGSSVALLARGRSKAAANNARMVETSKSCHLAELGEGLIGKLQIRKSGKTQLLIGETTLDVGLGADIGFLQDLVSIRIEDDSVGDMCVLGHVTHKLLCVPDLEALLDQQFCHRR